MSHIRVTEPCSESGLQTPEARNYPERNWGNKFQWARVGFIFRTCLIKSPPKPKNASLVPNDPPFHLAK